jgi:chemotaxis signal transduction protein
MSDATSQARYEEILEKRAQALAQVPTSQGERRLAFTVALVGLGGEVFGVPVDGMSEIVRAPPITPLPGLPAWMPGIVQIRGEVFGVVDMARWLGVDEPGTQRYLVVLSGFDVPLGLLVGSVRGFRDIYADEFASALRPEEHGRRPVSHTTRDLVSILDLPALVKSPDLRLSPRAHGQTRT